MIVEEIEKQDWGFLPGSDTGKELREKSIKAYHLKPGPDNWYEKMRDLTFETVFFTEIPEVLPFDKNMVRWENKSPKDSEYWGPVSTKQEVERLFYTSLRCKTNPGSLYCFRPWIKTYEEFRCFWNGTLRAVSGNEQDVLSSPIIKQIRAFVSSFADRIPFYRCVFDICRVVVDGDLQFRLIEFNSWETNSGGHHLHWIENTDMLYSEEGKEDLIYFVNRDSCITTEPLFLPPLLLPVDLEKRKRQIQEIIGGDYVLYDGHIYLHNDIWLGKFTMDLVPVAWARGVFRFSTLQFKQNKFYIGGKVYDKHLRKLSEQTVDYTEAILGELKYGIRFRSVDGVEVTAHLTDNCTFLFR